MGSAKLGAQPRSLKASGEEGRGRKTLEGSTAGSLYKIKTQTLKEWRFPRVEEVVR